MTSSSKRTAAYERLQRCRRWMKKTADVYSQDISNPDAQKVAFAAIDALGKAVDEYIDVTRLWVRSNGEADASE